VHCWPADGLAAGLGRDIRSGFRSRHPCGWNAGCLLLLGTGSYGFDASCNKYLDLIEARIIDPTRVVRMALENAVSVASVLLLTEATMTEIPEASDRSRAPGLPRKHEMLIS
jgi:hypothetical protein